MYRVSHHLENLRLVDAIVNVAQVCPMLLDGTPCTHAVVFVREQVSGIATCGYVTW